jgi:hypothetical protein
MTGTSASTPELSSVPIACQLGALTAAERAREHGLLQEHLNSVIEVRERADGYSFRYPDDGALFARMAALVALEHRCCPFLTFSLEWPGADSPPWLHVTGGERVKAFVAASFVRSA